MQRNISTDRKNLITKARRIVIKVGSAVLTGAGEGLDQKRIEQLTAEISAIIDRKCEVVLVSSGAIAAGLAKLARAGGCPAVRR